MKKFSIFLFVLVCFVGQVSTQEGETPVDSFEAATQAYADGDYFRARSIYEAAIESGFQHADIYFNLATILYQEGQIGESLLYFLKARHIEPRNTETNQMIARIRAERVNFQGDDRAIVDQIANTTVQIATTGELAIITFLMWNLFFILAVLWLVWKSGRLWLKRILMVLGAMLGLMLFLWIPRQYADTNRQPAVVTAIVAPAMSGPGNDYLELYRIYAAAEIRILETEGDWNRFIMPDGREGWINIVDIVDV